MSQLQSEFKNPSKIYRPRLRYWWPAGYVAHDLEELDKELESIAEAGFGGVEISDVYDAITPEDCKVLQPEEYGFTSANWKKSVKYALASAEKHGLDVDLTVSPHWPATTNEATPNQVGTAKELAYGTISFDSEVSAGSTILDLCPPHYVTNENMIDGTPIDNHLVALYKAEHVNHNEVLMPPPVPWEESYTVISDNISFNSLTEVTDKVVDGKLTEDLTGDFNKNILIAVYERGTGQRANMFSMGDLNRPDVMSPYAYVINHFSRAGTDLLIKLWEDNLLDNEMRDLISRVGSCFFEDSLELTSVGHWTENMLDEFKARKGYDIKPYLPFILGINQDKGLSVDSACFKVEEDKMGKVADLRHAYFEVLNELYRDYHVKPIRDWAHSLGMTFRAQPYGWAIDSAATAVELDNVEGESLGFGEEGNDAFRLLASGRDFGGHEVLSDEAGAYLFQGYATTIPQLFTTLNKNMLAGVNQTYWHGFPYKYAPGAKWPGFAAFSPMMEGRGFAEAWGPRHPVWQQLPAYTTYLARTGRILRYGKNLVDVLVYQDGHNASENKQVPVGKDLIRLGYNYQVMTEGLLDSEVTVENGRLTVAGASYGAVLVADFSQLSQNNKDYFTQWQAAGIKVVDQSIEGLDALVDKLGKSAFDQDTDAILTYHRKAEQEFYVIYNQGNTPVDISTFLMQQPLQSWDPWTGEVGRPHNTFLQANELRIFEVVEGQIDLDLNVKESIRSLKNNFWTLKLECWRMKLIDSFDTVKERRKIFLNRLVPWTELQDLEHVSGIGTYETTVDLTHVSRLRLPYIHSTAQVFVDGIELQGNPLIGEFILPKDISGKHILEITLGTTLNNYLNDCPLTNYYGTFEQQIYGLTDVFLVTEK